MKKTLVQLFEEIGNFSGFDTGQNDKNSTHTYLETYDKIFAPFRDGCVFLEIGLAGGDSVALWDAYFENSIIIGVDISLIFTPKKYRNNVILIEADATNPSFLEKIRGYRFDLVVEDSTHLTQDQLDIFKMLRPQINKNAVYIVEDLMALDVERKRYEKMHTDVEILDFRHVKGRFDDALVVLRNF